MAKPKTVVQTHIEGSAVHRQQTSEADKFVDYPKKATLTEAANARIRKHSAYWETVEKELIAAKGGLSMHNYEYFQKFREGKS